MRFARLFGSHLSDLRYVVFGAVCAVALLSAIWLPSAAAGPVNFGLRVYDVTGFGADRTGAVDSVSSINSALSSCTGSMRVVNNTAGCEIYFPAGVYKVLSGPILLPNQVPITIAGDGPLTSTLLAPGSSADIIEGVVPLAPHDQNDGFTIHDIGFEHDGGVMTPQAVGGSDIHIYTAQNVTMYNLYFHGAYAPINLGYADANGTHVGFTNVSAITSLDTVSCLITLAGGNGTTHIVGVTADGGHNVGSQILCLPSADAAVGSQYGTGTLRMSDSTFTAFGRGISVTAYSLSFLNSYFDNLVVDAAEDGPAFELFTAPVPVSVFPPPVISDVRISNSRLVSGATACVLHGDVEDVKLANDTCVGGATRSCVSGLRSIDISTGIRFGRDSRYADRWPKSVPQTDARLSLGDSLIHDRHGGHLGRHCSTARVFDPIDLADWISVRHPSTTRAVPKLSLNLVPGTPIQHRVGHRAVFDLLGIERSDDSSECRSGRRNGSPAKHRGDVFAR